MIGDNDMVVTRGIEVPKEMGELSCGALVAGVVEAVLDGAGFVESHSSWTLESCGDVEMLTLVRLSLFVFPSQQKLQLIQYHQLCILEEQ